MQIRRAVLLLGIGAVAGAVPVATAISAGAHAAHLAVQSSASSTSTRASDRSPATLNGVSCPSARVCAAVGYSQTATGQAVAVLSERWNGRRWSVQAIPSPAGATDPVLASVSCTSARACTAVGSYTPSGSSARVTLAERWNGRSWTIESTPNPTGSALLNSLASVSCGSPTACSAVGFTFDPNSTTVQSSPLAERWDASTWTIQPTAAVSATMSDVSCTSATACTAVGTIDDLSPAGIGGVFAERWNGTTWTVQAISDPPGTRGDLGGVSCTSAAACVAVGFAGPVDGGPYTPVAEHWNGTTWSIQPTPAPSGGQNSYLYGVSCTSTTACTAIGQYSTPTANVLFAERWNGTSWTVQSVPNPTGTSARGALLSTVSCTSATACTAVGSYNTSTSTTNTLAERWNGTTWTIQPTP